MNEIIKLKKVKSQIEYDLNRPELIKQISERKDAYRNSIELLTFYLIEAYTTLIERDDALIKLDVLNKEDLLTILKEKDLINNLIHALNNKLI